MKQQSLATQTAFEKYGRKSRREQALARVFIDGLRSRTLRPSCIGALTES